MKANAGIAYAVFALLLVAIAFPADTFAKKRKNTVYIAIIIDDIGNNWSHGLQAISLPGPVAISIIPDLPYSTQLAEYAHGQHKDVILHLPMEPRSRKELLSANGLRTDMNAAEVSRALEHGLTAVPFAVAVNNHMGSQYTRDRRALGRLMAAIRKQDSSLFFIDSLTTRWSKARKQASAHGIPSLARDVFLDNKQDETAIEQQFDQLLAIARKRGYAIAIGHPYAETLNVLRKRLQPLSEGNIRLVPLTLLIAMTAQEREPWR